MNTFKIKRMVYIILGIAIIALSIPGFLKNEQPGSPEAGATPADIASIETDSSISEKTSHSSSHASNSGQESKNHHWGNPRTLQDHFDRHGADFDAKDPQDYARMANELYQNRENYQVKLDENGISRIYDEETNSFGAYNKNGSTRSFFKPSAGQAYFDRQPGNED